MRYTDSPATMSQEPLVSAIRAAAPDASVEAIGTGGGCDALAVRHPARPGIELLITDGDARVPLTDGRYAFGLFAGLYSDYGITPEHNATDDESDALVWLGTDEVESMATADVTARIVAAIVAWITPDVSETDLGDADFFVARCNVCGADFETTRREGAIHYPDDSDCGGSGTVIRGYRHTN